MGYGPNSGYNRRSGFVKPVVLIGVGVVIASALADNGPNVSATPDTVATASPSATASEKPSPSPSPKKTEKPAPKPKPKKPASNVYGTKVPLVAGSIGPAVLAFKRDAIKAGCGSFSMGNKLDGHDMDNVLQLQKDAGLPKKNQAERVGAATRKILKWQIEHHAVDCGTSYKLEHKKSPKGPEPTPYGCPGGPIGPGVLGTVCPDGSVPFPDNSLPEGCPGSGDAIIGGSDWNREVYCPKRPGQPAGHYRIGQRVRA